MDQLPSFDQTQPLETAPQSAPPALPSFEETQPSREDQYGSLGQQALTAIEGAGRGLSFGLTDAAALGLRSLGESIGVDPDIMAPAPKEIAARQAENPWVSRGAEAASLVLGAVTGSGAPGMISAFSAAAVPAAETVAGRIGATALQGAIESGLIQGGDEISKAMLGTGDQEAPVASALTNIGAAGLFGGALGGVFGGIGEGLHALASTKYAKAAGDMLEDLGRRIGLSKVVPTAEEMAAETAATRATLLSPTTAFKEIPKLKPDAVETMAAADRLGLPVMNGMISGDRSVRLAEDALLKSAETGPAIRRQALYNKAHEGVVSAIDDVIPDVRIEKLDVGRQIQEGLSAKIAAESKPFGALYSEIKEVTPDIILKQKSAPAIARSIENIEGVREAFKSPSAQLARDIAEEIKGGSIGTVEQLRAYQSELSRRLSPTASASEKRILSIVRDKLDDWERRAIRDHADEFISSIERRADMTQLEKQQIWGDKIARVRDLQSKIDEADSLYAPFRQKISELASWLGKEKIGGAKDATSFINERLEPEDLITKLSSNKYAGLADFMKKNFPEEYELVKQYHKSQFRQAASKGAEFQPKIVLKKFNELPKSAKEAIFSPEEIQKLSDVRQYLNSFPENFNPSGTSHILHIRGLLSGPKEFLKAHTVDQALEKMIIGKDMAPALKQILGRPITDPEAATILKVMSEGSVDDIAHMVDYVSKVEKGVQKINKGIENVFRVGGQQAIDEFISQGERDKRLRERLKKNIEENTLDHELQDAASSPMGFAEGGDVGVPKSASPLERQAPAQNMMIQSAKGRINNYLSSLRPIKASNLPFDKSLKNKQQDRDYEKVLDIANKPLNVLNQIKAGTLTPGYMKHFVALYPEVHNHLSKKLTEKITDIQMKGDSPPPAKVRQSLSLFLGATLDSSMKPANIAAAQAVYASKRQQQMPTTGSAPKKNTSALAKVPGGYQTPDQANVYRDQVRR